MRELAAVLIGCFAMALLFLGATAVIDHANDRTILITQHLES